MTSRAIYDVEAAWRDLHRVILEFGESLDEDELRWRPDGYATSIGFHLWHVARESDYLRSAIVERLPQLGPEFGGPAEIWAREALAERWGFPEELGATVGTGLSDEVAAGLPIPPKAELLDYLLASFSDLEAFVARIDDRYADPSAAGELGPRIENVRRTFLVFLTHDCRHLGVMEALKGLLTGFGSATERRPERAGDRA